MAWVRMKIRQITIGFQDGVTLAALVKMLSQNFGKVTVGKGIAENGIPANFIIVEGKKKNV
jgi:hypothetical protein